MDHSAFCRLLGEEAVTSQDSVLRVLVENAAIIACVHAEPAVLKVSGLRSEKHQKKLKNGNMSVSSKDLGKKQDMRIECIKEKLTRSSISAHHSH